jgi:hypothetical protein
MGRRVAKNGFKEPREVAPKGAPKGAPEGPRKDPRRGSKLGIKGCRKDNVSYTPRKF